MTQRREEDGAVRLLAKGLAEGAISVPMLLLKAYGKLRLSEADAMLLIHLMAYRDKEHKEFPTIEELGERMSLDAFAVESILQRLMQRGLLAIDEWVDARTGIHSERYNWDALFLRLAELEADAGSAGAAAGEGDAEINLFGVFEQEFGRPLSPMECETIAGWIDQDRHEPELILLALKEAVFAGKLHFRYIDRILLEWSRNRIRSVEEAKQFSRKYRGERR